MNELGAVILTAVYVDGIGAQRDCVVSGDAGLDVVDAQRLIAYDATVSRTPIESLIWERNAFSKPGTYLRSISINATA